MDYDDTRLWTSDVSLLYAGGRARQLIPTKEMTFAQRVNALVRFTILATVCVYLYNRDTRYVLYGLFSVALLTAVAALGRKPAAVPPPPLAPLATLATPATRGGPGDPAAPVAPTGPYDCTHPTVNNPFANVLLSDYKYHPDRPPACDVDQVADEIKRAYGASIYRDADDIDFRKSGINSFMTMPDTTTWQAGREAFAQACYGSGPTCKEDQKMCG